MSKKRKRSQGGYTLIEVLMAIGVMTVGAVGIMALQQATTRGNTHARQMSVATEFTRTWLERIRRDALTWNQPGLAGTAGTRFLSNVLASGGTIGEWFTPDTTGSPFGEHPSANWQGVDTNGTDAGPMVYCTNVRLRWVIDQQAIRADVRTWWHRTSHADDREVSDRSLYVNCNGGDAAAITTELSRTPASRLHAVTGSILVRWTPIEGT